MNAISTQIKQLRETARLVRAAQQGDREAFGELFTRYQGAVYAIALRRLGDATEAQELCQDVFVKAMEKLHQLCTPECFGGWLRSITVRMAINRIVRRRQAVTTQPEALSNALCDEATPQDAAIQQERKAHLRSGLRRLRAMDRETLVAFYIKGQSLAEMSDRFDAPIGTIKRRLHVARKRLADQVDQLSNV